MEVETQNFTCDWRIDEEVSGPAASVFIAVILLLSFIANLFICLHTVIHGKVSLKESSTLLLFNLSLSNFIMTILYMPFAVVALAAQEWIIGVTDDARSVLCTITGIIFTMSGASALHTLGAISFDRCLFVVKPRLHKKIMSWKTALVIVIIVWVYSMILAVIPDVASRTEDACINISFCIPINLTSFQGYIIGLAVLVFIPFIIMIVTSVWTCIFTRAYLKKTIRRHRNTLRRNKLDIQENIYNVQVRKLVGIFGALFFFNLITLGPFYIICFVDAITHISPQAVIASLVLFLLSAVTNPLIQSYFRRDLQDSVVKFVRRLRIFNKCIENDDSIESSNSKSNKFSSSRDGAINDSVFLPEKVPDNVSSVAQDTHSDVPDHTNAVITLEVEISKSERDNKEASVITEENGDDNIQKK